jgi:MFS family permease
MDFKDRLNPSEELSPSEDHEELPPVTDTMISVPDTPETVREKTIMIRAMCVNTFACMCMQMNVSSLLPAYIDENYPGINALQVGVLMAIFPVGFLLAAPAMGFFAPRIGRKNCLYLGVYVMTLATLCFGLASFFETPWIFYTVSFVARFVQGIAQATVNVTSPSIISQEFPNDRPAKLAYINMAMGLGLALGPVIGSVVYSLMSYLYTFVFFSAYICVIGTICVYLVPARINNKPVESANGSENNPLAARMTFRLILTNLRCFSVLFICSFGQIACLVIEPVLSVRLINMGMKESLTGLAFGLLGGAEMMGANAAGWLGGKFNLRVMQ